ncbi:SAM-dependent methyltransferase [Actinoallomurus liliacearum]|uniref:SAM-dependent methyltransferase n=2 Tax=Actinoallomurus liliacearum TaxID=1080073 RepID=A0ABP8TC23_9ACTN
MGQRRITAQTAQNGLGQLAYNPLQPSPARMYDYYLGGKDNGPADREAAKEAIKRVPNLPLIAKENRVFLQRAVRYLHAVGIRQIVDIGAGLPTLTNTHEVAQQRARETRVVYVDNDPLVLAHGHALLATNDRTTIVQADLRNPDGIIEHPELKKLIDWDEPVGVLAVAVLHFVRDDEAPYGAVAKLRAAMAPGSYLVLSHAELNQHTQHAAEVYNEASAPAVPRTREEIERFFSGFQLVRPGLIPVSRWRRPGSQALTVPFLGGVGRKQEDERHG